MNFSRRKFLRVNGAAMALPFLPSLAKADEGLKVAGGLRKKLIIIYMPNGIVRRCFFPGEENADLPDFIGGFDADKVKNERRVKHQPGIYPLELTSTMQPLAEHLNDITLITGLDRSYKDGQDVHAQGASCYLSNLSPVQAAERRIVHPNGRTLDQVIGDNIGHSTIFNTLEISCNGVTDLVLADANMLSRKLGSDDRRTLGEFMELVRGIELRIDKMDKLLAEVDVRVPQNQVLPRGEYIRLQMDLMLMALQMGITNVCTFMLGPERWDASLMYEGVFEQPVEHHNMTHNQKGEGYKELQKIDIFHMQQYAYLIGRMKALKEPDGSSLLDNSLIAYGAGLGDGATHQYFDLPMIVAGKSQGQIKQGRFIKMPSGTLNSNLWLTIAQLMGLEIESFSDSTGVISDLWT